MTNAEIIAALTAYILSLAATLIIMITIKGRTAGLLKYLSGIHILLFIAFIISLAAGIHLSHYAFLFFFCSGILCGGAALRTGISLPIKIYSAIYIASVGLFLVWPSGLVRMITFHAPADHKGQFLLSGNYYIEEEKSLLNLTGGAATYKLTEKHGFFHKTLARQLSFGGRIDSVLALTLIPDEVANIRAYLTVKSPTFESDSMDISVPLTPAEGKITQKRKKQL